MSLNIARGRNTHATMGTIRPGHGKYAMLGEDVGGVSYPQDPLPARNLVHEEQARQKQQEESLEEPTNDDDSASKTGDEESLTTSLGSFLGRQENSSTQTSEDGGGGSSASVSVDEEDEEEFLENLPPMVPKRRRSKSSKKRQRQQRAAERQQKQAQELGPPALMEKSFDKDSLPQATEDSSSNEPETPTSNQKNDSDKPLSNDEEEKKEEKEEPAGSDKSVGEESVVETPPPAAPVLNPIYALARRLTVVHEEHEHEETAKEAEEEGDAKDAEQKGTAKVEEEVQEKADFRVAENSVSEDKDAVADDANENTEVSNSEVSSSGGQNGETSVLERSSLSVGSLDPHSFGGEKHTPVEDEVDAAIEAAEEMTSVLQALEAAASVDNGSDNPQPENKETDSGKDVNNNPVDDNENIDDNSRVESSVEILEKEIAEKEVMEARADREAAASQAEDVEISASRSIEFNIANEPVETTRSMDIHFEITSVEMRAETSAEKQQEEEEEEEEEEEPCSAPYSAVYLWSTSLVLWGLCHGITALWAAVQWNPSSSSSSAMDTTTAAFSLYFPLEVGASLAVALVALPHLASRNVATATSSGLLLVYSLKSLLCTFLASPTESEHLWWAMEDLWYGEEAVAAVKEESVAHALHRRRHVHLGAHTEQEDTPHNNNNNHRPHHHHHHHSEHHPEHNKAIATPSSSNPLASLAVYEVANVCWMFVVLMPYVLGTTSREQQQRTNKSRRGGVELLGLLVSVAGLALQGIALYPSLMQPSEEMTAAQRIQSEWGWSKREFLERGEVCFWVGLLWINVMGQWRQQSKHWGFVLLQCLALIVAVTLIMVGPEGGTISACPHYAAVAQTATQTTFQRFDPFWSERTKALQQCLNEAPSNVDSPTAGSSSLFGWIDLE